MSMRECVCVCVHTYVCALGGNERAVWLMFGQNISPKAEEKLK